MSDITFLDQIYFFIIFAGQSEKKRNFQIYPMCMVGTELVNWLSQLSTEILNEMATPLTRLQVVGMWQVLLENGIINHGENMAHYIIIIEKIVE